MEGTSLTHRQINEKMARVVDRFEICVTMTWFGMVANAMSANSPGSLSTKVRRESGLRGIISQCVRIRDIPAGFRRGLQREERHTDGGDPAE